MKKSPFEGGKAQRSFSEVEQGDDPPSKGLTQIFMYRFEFTRNTPHILFCTNKMISPRGEISNGPS